MTKKNFMKQYPLYWNVFQILDTFVKDNAELLKHSTVISSRLKEGVEINYGSGIVLPKDIDENTILNILDVVLSKCYSANDNISMVSLRNYITHNDI